MNIKKFTKSVLNTFHLDLTKNLKYDRLTKLIINKVLASNSNCIDIGCYKGEILDLLLTKSPNGTHYAFEPIPLFFNTLKTKYNKNVIIYPFALSNSRGTSTFQYVRNDPSYSGLNKRKYNNFVPDIEEISVELRKLDDIIPVEVKIDFIKIDVEGSEFGVLKGAKQTLINSKPFIVFESGLGASDYYGTDPKELYEFITSEIGLKISLLQTFIVNEQSLTSSQFIAIYNANKEYYFIAHR